MATTSVMPFVLPEFIAAMPSPLPELAIAALIAVFVAIAVYMTKSFISVARGAPWASTIVLTGPMGSGKTCTYYRLLQNCFRETVPSVAINQSSIILPTSTATVVDYPGHGSKRYGLSARLDNATTVVFMVDASAAGSVIAAAKDLYSVLIHPSVHKGRISIIIACNKSDLPNALSADKIKTELENEIHKLQHAMDSMKDIDSKELKRIFLGDAGANFRFSLCKNRITIGSISAKENQLEFLLANIQ